MFTDLFGFKKRKAEKLSQEILQRADAELVKITKHKTEEYERRRYEREADERFERQRIEEAETVDV